MPENHLAVRPRSDKIAIAPTQLKPQEKSLLVELALTAENAKSEISPELQAEFLREFGESPGAEAIAAAFRRWRRRSNFIPSIAEMDEMLQEVAHDCTLEKATAQWERDKADAERALKEWEDPAQKAEHARIVADLGKRLTLIRMNDLARPDPTRSPRNVIALSQAQVLRDLPPKKHPGQLGADAGESQKAVRKVVAR